MKRRLWSQVPDLAQLAAELPQSQEFCPPSRYEEEVWKLLSNPEGINAGADHLPFRHELFAFRPGESTLWAGANSSGKSTVISQCEVQWALTGRNVVSLSLEEDPAAKVERYVRQVLGSTSTRITHKAYGAALDALDEHLILLDISGRLEPLHALALMQFASKQYRADHFVLDNLTMCVPLGQESDTVLQSFVGSSHAIARATRMHCHLVAHIRKPLDNRPAGRYDIRGTGSASDQVDNVLMLWRDELSEDKAEIKGSRGDAPESILKVDKQRRTGRRGTIPLWHHQCSLQFLTSPAADPRRFIDSDQLM